jgi:guanylate kinase
VILEIEVQGARQVKQRMPAVRTVFIAPPSWDTLKDRLVGRGTETAEQMARRLRTAETELALAAEFDHVVVNDDLGTAVAELVELLGL